MNLEGRKRKRNGGLEENTCKTEKKFHKKRVSRANKRRRSSNEKVRNRRRQIKNKGRNR